METLARPYARAAFHIAAAKKSDGQTPQSWLDFLSAAVACVAEPKLAAYMDNPAESREKKQDVLLQLIKDAGIKTDKLRQNFLALLLLNNRLQLLPTILNLFREMTLHSQNVVAAHVRSAFPLSDAEQKQLEELLSKAQGTAVLADVTTDKELIGGLVIEMRGHSWDYSVRGKLEALRKGL